MRDVLGDDPLAYTPLLGETITTAQMALDRFHDDRSVVKRPPRLPRWLEDVTSIGRVAYDGDPW